MPLPDHFWGVFKIAQTHMPAHMKYSKSIKAAHLYPCPTCLPGAHRFCGDISLVGRRSPISEIKSKSHQWVTIEDLCWHPRARGLHREYQATLGTNSRNSLWAVSDWLHLHMDNQADRPFISHHEWLNGLTCTVVSRWRFSREPFPTDMVEATPPSIDGRSIIQPTLQDTTCVLKAVESLPLRESAHLPPGSHLQWGNKLA